jgi:hypothetical protein
MKKSLLIVAGTVIMITAVLLTGCVAPIIKKEAGPTSTREYNFTDFNRIEIGDAFKLEVTPADTYSIQIDASENLFDHIEVTKTGNKLKIDMDNLFFSFHRSPRVKITMPELWGLYMSGASEGSVTGFRSSYDFDLTLSGASELNMDMETGAFEGELSGASEVSGHLKATNCDIELSGASETTLDGSGGNIRLEASGASDIDLDNFTVNDADINLSGASDASLDINGKLDVSLSGASLLEYSGNPTLGNFDVTGGSELERRQR